MAKLIDAARVSELSTLLISADQWLDTFDRWRVEAEEHGDLETIKAMQELATMMTSTRREAAQHLNAITNRVLA